MTEQSRQPKDKNYNLISMLYHSAEVVEVLKTYIRDAEEEGDQRSLWTSLTRPLRTT